ncbi:aldehyde ferredoxin oxidoreductase family protein [Chloroflexota bacterium]
MGNGYMGMVLWVNLAKGELKDEALDEKLCRDFIGGYGIGARLIYSRQKGRVDALGPENTLGFITGPLTGTDAPFGSRYEVVAKSPLTGGWGDANSGGDWGAYLKFAGYDGVFFTGASAKPVYLIIKEGKAELKDASHLWGKDVHQTEAALMAELGQKGSVVSIGPSGEKLSLISCPVNNEGRAPGRSGLGAVMGSKKLKAIAVTGTAKVPVADVQKARSLRREYLGRLKGGSMDYLGMVFADVFRNFGTSGITADSAFSGDSPVKNWGGVGRKDFPNVTLISDENVRRFEEKKYGCYRCPFNCGGLMKAGTEYQYKAGTHKPEYETLCAFGTMCLNDNLESITKANDICNRYGLDTISAGGTIAFAIECYENGIITKQDTDGIELTWGNHKAIIDMLEKLAKREGFGDVLADGVRVAAQKIGKGAEEYAIHVGGQELPMHDSRFAPSHGMNYQADPTPGRHTQGGLAMGAGIPGLNIPDLDKYTYHGKGKYEAIVKNQIHMVNCTGMCLFGWLCFPWDELRDVLSAVTGWQLSQDDVCRAGERIATLRQAFNVREGLSPEDFKMPPRVLGQPPLKEGPLANITIDNETQVREYYKAMGWDPKTGKPVKDKLVELGLEDVARDLWP